MFSFAVITRYVRKLQTDCQQLQQMHPFLRSALRTTLASAYRKADPQRKAAQSAHSTAIATQRGRGRLTRDDKRNPTAAGYEGPQRAERWAAEIPAGRRAASGRGDGGVAAPLCEPPPAGPVTCSSSARRSSSCPRRPCAPWRT